MSNKRMAGDKLKREEYRKRLLTDEDLRDKRISRITYNDGLEGLPEDYDEIALVKALRGGWGKDDLGRYNKIMGIKPKDPKDPKPPADPPGGGGNNGGINIDTGGDQNIDKPKPPAQPPAERPPTPLYGGVTQEINQDNDIVNTITGNNNTVNNTQDNSISQKVYGGSNRYFNYNSSPKMPVEPNPGTDSTMPTMNAKDFLKDFMKDFYSDTIVI